MVKLFTIVVAGLFLTAAPLSAADKAPEPMRELVLTRDKDLGVAQVTQGRAGDLWLQSRSRGLLRWTGKGWDATPHKPLPYPVWQAHPAAPWAGWQQPPLLLTGTIGFVLHVAVRDVYQDAAREAGANWQRAAAEKIEKMKLPKPYWLEGALYEDGKWTGPMEITRLLLQERKRLIKEFAGTASAGDYFQMVSDGQRLWAAYGQSVFAIQEDGTQDEWKDVVDKARPALPEVGLTVLPGGKVWYTQRTKTGFAVASLTVKDGRIKAEELPGASFTLAHNYQLRMPHYHVSRSGEVWCWIPYSNDRGRGRVYRWRDGKWHERADLDRFCLEDADGYLWFTDKLVDRKDQAYRLVKGDTTHELAWPYDWFLGQVTRVSDTKLVVACAALRGSRARLVTLVAVKDAPGQWKIGDVYGLPYLGRQPRIFLDGRGHVVEETGWVGTLPEKAGTER